MDFNNHNSNNTYIPGIGRGRGNFLNPSKTFIPGRGRGRGSNSHNNFNNRAFNSNVSTMQNPADRSLPANFDRRLDSSLREISHGNATSKKNNFRNAKYNKNTYNTNHQQSFNQKHTEKANTFAQQSSSSNNLLTANSSNNNNVNRNVNTSLPVGNTPFEAKEERPTFQNISKNKKSFPFATRSTDMPLSWSKPSRNDIPPQVNTNVYCTHQTAFLYILSFK